MITPVKQELHGGGLGPWLLTQPPQARALGTEYPSGYLTPLPPDVGVVAPRGRLTDRLAYTGRGLRRLGKDLELTLQAGIRCTNQSYEKEMTVELSPIIGAIASSASRA